MVGGGGFGGGMAVMAVVDRDMAVGSVDHPVLGLLGTAVMVVAVGHKNWAVLLLAVVVVVASVQCALGDGGCGYCGFICSGGGGDLFLLGIFSKTHCTCGCTSCSLILLSIEFLNSLNFFFSRLFFLLVFTLSLCIVPRSSGKCLSISS